MHQDTSSISEAPILVAMDLGERCRECLEQAWRMAQQRGQTLIIAHVAHETVQTAGSYQRKNRGDAMLPIEEIARNLLADFVDAFIHDNPDFRTVDSRQVVVSGIPETRIPELATLYHAGAIVIGHSQPSGIAGVLQRATGQTVLNTAPCPVFLLDGPDLVAGAEPIPSRNQQPSSLRSALHLQ